MSTGASPERDTGDVCKVQFPFQHLFDQPFLGSLLHLLSTNQIDALRGQDQISLDRLCGGKWGSENRRHWRNKEEGCDDTSFSLYRLKMVFQKVPHLEPAVELVHRIGKVNALSLGQKLPQLGSLLQAEVISNKVPVDAVLPPLFGVVQDVRGWASRGETNGYDHDEWNIDLIWISGWLAEREELIHPESQVCWTSETSKTNRKVALGDQYWTRQRNLCFSSLTFFSHLFILLPGVVFSPGLLNNSGERVKLPLPHLLKKKELKEKKKKNTSLVSDSRGWICQHHSVLLMCLQL